MKNILIGLLLIYTADVLSQDFTPPAVPQGVKAFGYEKHVDIEWYNNSEPDVAGYKIYIKSGQNYNYFTSVSNLKSYYSINMNLIGIPFTFKISAYDSSGNESPLSDSAYAITHTINDEEFLDMVQRATFRYFWDWGDPISGIARERWQPDEKDVTNTIGGGGFGVLAILVGIERGFITRQQGAERMYKIVDFLANKIDKFHGAFPHWFNGTTGKVVNFGVQDGGDIVETAFMIQGLLAARQYFNRTDSTEEQIRNLITQLWHDVDWNFYRNNSSGLYWNWSPTYGFNFSDTFIFHGWNETLIAYILAIASPTHAVSISPSSFYRSGWGNNGQISSLRMLYSYLLYVGSSYGGPLFFTHYSFLGFDPRNKKDMYANYFTHNKNQALVNRQYCITNPKGYVGYGANNWGLTASYSIPGVYYLAHDPNNDNGTISPTAALSSMPYTPNESIAALKYFYRTYGSELWGDFGFRDAFNLTYSSKGVSGRWFSDGYLAIDQGPIIVMIENYRSGLLWNLFMANPEIQTALNAIGFVPDSTTDVQDESISVNDFVLLGNYPNPFNPNTTIVFSVPARENVVVTIFNQLGEKIKDLVNAELQAGENKIIWNGLNNENKSVSSGIYIYRISTPEKYLSGKMILQK
ncbi:MAG TPA: glucoamylase family protein [Ignavibacteriaceae bacterium]|nr:glucoamylase family protein [Ignavibacteriaceae bacterium]